MKKAVGKVLVCLLLGVLVRVASAEDGWVYVSDRNNHRVAVLVKMLYYPAGGCSAIWRFENQNDFPVRVEITDKSYVWRGGSEFVKYGTWADLPANGTLNGKPGGDAFNRGNGGGDPLATVRVENFKMSVKRL
jgi:predicted DNA-binding transcriptional regulator AlpA